MTENQHPKLLFVILSAAKNQVGMDAIELRGPSPALVILSAAKNLVPQHPSTTFPTAILYRKKKETSG